MARSWRWRTRLLGRLGLSDLPLAAYVAAVAFYTTYGLRFRLDRQLISRASSSASSRDLPSPEHLDRLVRVTDSVLGLAKPLLRSECLTRTLVLAHVLRRWGYGYSIEFGVSNDDQLFRSHCWLVHAGEPVFEESNPRAHFRVIHSVGHDIQGSTGLNGT